MCPGIKYNLYGREAGGFDTDFFFNFEIVFILHVTCSNPAHVNAEVILLC
jgi:hypothetical protein